MVKCLLVLRRCQSGPGRGGGRRQQRLTLLSAFIMLLPILLLATTSAASAASSEVCSNNNNGDHHCDPAPPHLEDNAEDDLDLDLCLACPELYDNLQKTIKVKSLHQLQKVRIN